MKLKTIQTSAFWSRIVESINNSYYLKQLIAKSILALEHNPIYIELHYKRALKKIQKLSGCLPSYLYIETTNFCNAKCIMCPHSKMRRPKGYMDMDLFKKIVDDAASIGIKTIGLVFMGEPLLDKRIFDRIKYIKDKNIRVVFNTNASLLSRDKSRKLIENKLDQIIISFDAFKKRTYEKIRAGLDYDKVIANIKSLIALKKEMRAKYPIIELTFVDVKVNHNEARLFYNFWKGKVDKVIISYVRDWATQVKVESEISPHINLRMLQKNPCDSLWKDLVITWDGKAVLCCNDYEGEIIMGDLTKQSILDVWNGKKFLYYRKMHMYNKRDILPLCKKCLKYSFWW